MKSYVMLSVIMVTMLLFFSCNDTVSRHLSGDNDTIVDNDAADTAGDDDAVDTADDVTDTENDEDIVDTGDDSTDTASDDDTVDTGDDSTDTASDDDIGDTVDDTDIVTTSCDLNPCTMPHTDGNCTPQGDDYSCGCLLHYTWRDTDKFCVADSRRTDCVNFKPDNSHYAGDNDDGKFEQTWYIDAWIPDSTECLWECDANYDNPVADSCINEQTVSCDANNKNPKHSHDLVGNVTISYTDIDGWETPSACAWECDDYYIGDGSGTLCVETEFAGGTGTEDDPYLIATPFHLNNVRNYPDAYFLQIKDVDLTEYLAAGGDQYNSGQGWNPLPLFTGHYNGDQYLISGLKIEREKDDIGLFSKIGATGQVMNTHLVDANVVGKKRVGILAGSLDGMISYCYAKGFAKATAGVVGGLVGLTFQSNITNSYAMVDVEAGTASTSQQYAGGLVGNAWDTIIRLTYSTGHIKCSDHCGGLVGDTSTTIYTSLYNSDTSTGSNTTGYTTEEMTYSYGTYTPDGPYFHYDFAHVWQHDVSGLNEGYPILRIQKEFAGGDGSAEYPFLIATPHQLDHVRRHLNAHFELVSYIEMELLRFVNNPDGWTPLASFSASANTEFTGSFDGKGYVIGDLYINDPTLPDASLFGAVDSAVLTNVEIENSDITGESRTATLAGHVVNSDISQCAGLGSITGTGSITGGLIGYLKTSSVRDSYAIVAVHNTADSSTYPVGGFIGNVWGSGNTITHCYSRSTVSATSAPIGAFLGKMLSASIVDSCAVDTDRAGLDDLYANNFTSAEMVSPYGAWNPPDDKNGPYYQWDFFTIWENSTGRAPTLRH